MVEPEGGPRAVFKRPLTILQVSDGIIRGLIHFTKTHAERGIRMKRMSIFVDHDYCAFISVYLCVWGREREREQRSDACNVF